MSYTPLSDQYYAGVLDFGGVRILLDCGCDIDFQNLGDKIAAVAPTVDLVLLSHAELRHVGALPAAKARYGLAAPVFATTPTIKNGALTLYEAWGGFRAAKGRAAAKELFTLDDVDAAFDKIRALKFDQPLSLRGRGAGVVVTAHRAGHSVGGAYWRISRGADEVVYAVDVHHARERHVDGTALAARGPDRRPAVLICDAGPLSWACRAGAAAPRGRGRGRRRALRAAARRPALFRPRARCGPWSCCSCSTKPGAGGISAGHTTSSLCTRRPAACSTLRGRSSSGWRPRRRTRSTARRARAAAAATRSRCARSAARRPSADCAEIKLPASHATH